MMVKGVYIIRILLFVAPIFVWSQSKKPNLEDSPVTRNIRMLENRLDKALIKFNEAQVNTHDLCCI
mgnify:CR=1 FL=1